MRPISLGSNQPRAVSNASEAAIYTGSWTLNSGRFGAVFASARPTTWVQKLPLPRCERRSVVSPVRFAAMTMVNGGFWCETNARGYG